MASPRFEKVREYFRQIKELEDEIEKLIAHDHWSPDEPIGVVTKVELRNNELHAEGRMFETSPRTTLNDISRRACGCALKGRSRSKCRICNPTIEDFVPVQDETGPIRVPIEPDALAEDPPESEGWEKPADQVCECGGKQRHKRSCSRRDKPIVVYADEQLQPLKKYRCIECLRVMESRLHRLDIICENKFCKGTKLVEVYESGNINQEVI